MHRGKTHHMCKKCGKHLASSHMMDMHEISCGSTEFAHNCKTCGRGYHTKQVLVQHLKVHRPLASREERTCPDCKVEFKLVKTMREHWATHRGPFPCPVEDCPAIFSLPKCHNRHHVCISLFLFGRLILKLVDCSFYYRSLVLVDAVPILRMKLLKLSGNHSIDPVACTIFNTKLLVDCMVT